MTRPLNPEEVGALALGLMSHRPDDETWAVTARMMACAQADYLAGAGLTVVPSDERERYEALREAARLVMTTRSTNVTGADYYARREAYAALRAALEELR